MRVAKAYLKKKVFRWRNNVKDAFLKIVRWCKENKALVVVAAGILLLDRLTKVWVLYTLPDAPKELFPFFHLRYVENTGAAFGMLQNGNLPLIFVMLVIIAYVCWNWKELVSFGVCSRWGALFILAGALGNLYDRITLGFVVDFLDFRVWPVFNVADSFITVGACLFALSLFLNRKRTGTEAK